MANEVNRDNHAKPTPPPQADRRGAIILAGGDSKRLGQPKALLDFYGKTMIEIMVERLSAYFDQLTVVTDRPELYRGLPVLMTGDRLHTAEKSPLRGIHAGLSASDLPYQFVVACDMPFLNLGLVKYMARFAPQFDAVVPREGEHYQPLHAFYSRSCIPVVENQARRGCFKVTDFYYHLRVRFITLEEILSFDARRESFLNINTRRDYEEALDLMAGEMETG